MAFQINYAATTESDGIKPEGNYECIIKSVEEDTNKNGKTRLNIALVIRNDVPNQKYGNAMLFLSIWKAKEPTDADKSVDGYLFGRIMALSKAAGLSDSKNYKNMAELCADLQGKCLLATVKHETYNNKLQEVVSKVDCTKQPNCKHVFKQSAQAPIAPAVPQPEAGLTDYEEIIGDGDLPF